MSEDATIRVKDREAAGLALQRGLDGLLAGEAMEAARGFRLALELDFDQVAAHHGYVRALLLAGRPRASVAAALALSIVAARDPLAHAALALSLQAAGLEEQAQKALARVHKLAAELECSSSSDSSTEGKCFATGPLDLEFGLLLRKQAADKASACARTDEP